MNKFNLEEMRERLDAEIKRQRRSRTEVSLSSGNSKGYLTGILTRGQAPSVDRLDAICRELNVPMSWVLYGVNLPPNSEAVFDLLADNPRKFYALLDLAKS